ncbi:MAG: class I SAM-dependent methyltransferase [Chloroflexi bacterium]|nr:class I SAM-dependent methyltransferase [Chloroflexota bacterium]
MEISVPILLLGLAAAGVALGWWLLIQTEGVYLGPRVVRWLYDRSAHEYDEIKQFDDESDDRNLGEPLAERLAGNPDAWLLDVGTGTARLPLALFRHLDFKGRAVGLDSSREMLGVAAAKTVFFAESLDLIEGDGRALPFASGSCAAVTCVEALEFFPSPRQTLGEMARVLRPGGTLVVSNRRGFDRWTFPGRGYSAAAFERLLSEVGLCEIVTQRWLTYYDLIWARKPD